MNSKRKPENESELLFVEYLVRYGYDWDFEPSIEGKNKCPDFLVRWNGDALLFEVKERQGHGEPPRCRHLDPVKGIREKIEKARSKFAKFKEFCCCLVVYNAGDSSTKLTVRNVFAAMLGDLGVKLRINEGMSKPEVVGSVFLESGGKMVRYKTGEYQNTTISAVVVLERLSLGDLCFDRAVKAKIDERERTLGRSLEGHERTEIRWDLARESPLPLGSERVARVLVCEHPSPRVPLPRGVFNGPYDERYALEHGSIQRVFCGAQRCGASNGEGRLAIA